MKGETPALLKCIVWDLDNTLWHGTLAEGDYPVPNPEVLSILQEADAHGVIQSIVSRNDHDAAMRALSSLSLAHFFVYPQISPYIIKSDALRDIAARFNLAVKNMAFVDDEAFERYETHRFLPEAYVYAVEELSILQEQLQRLPTLSSERRAWMQQREARLEAEKAFDGSRADFLSECKMILTLREAETLDFPRVAELAERATKINNTAGSMSAAFSSEGTAKTNQRLYVCTLTDIFGSHGITGAGMFRRDGNYIHMGLFCVSCRVEGRGIAAAFLNAALQSLTEIWPNAKELRCRVNDAREGMVLALLKSFGFYIYQSEGNTAYAKLTLPHPATAVAWITVEKQI